MINRSNQFFLIVGLLWCSLSYAAPPTMTGIVIVGAASDSASEHTYVGFVADNNGHIIVHTLNAPTATLYVRAIGGATYEAQTVVRDAGSDLTLLKVSGATPAPYTFARDLAKVQRKVFAVQVTDDAANAHMISGSLTKVQQLETGGPSYYLHNALVGKRGAGGPLFNNCGEVVGVMVEPKKGWLESWFGGGDVHTAYAITAEWLIAQFSAHGFAPVRAPDSCLSEAEQAAAAEQAVAAEKQAIEAKLEEETRKAAAAEQAAAAEKQAIEAKLEEETRKAAAAEQAVAAEKQAIEAKLEEETRKAAAAEQAAAAEKQAIEAKLEEETRKAAAAEQAAAAEKQAIEAKLEEETRKAAAAEQAAAAEKQAIEAKLEEETRKAADAEQAAAAEKQAIEAELEEETRKAAAAKQAAAAEKQAQARQYKQWGIIGATILLLLLLLAWVLKRRAVMRERSEKEAARNHAAQAQAQLAVREAAAERIRQTPTVFFEGTDSARRSFALRVPGASITTPKGTVIGRNPSSSDFVINHPEVSRRQFRLFVEDNQLKIEDLGSTNGTIVDGKKLVANQKVALADLSRVNLSGLELTVRFERTDVE